MIKPHIKLKVKPSLTTEIAWLNLYVFKNKNYFYTGSIYRTKEEADAVAKTYRFACVPVETPIFKTPLKKINKFSKFHKSNDYGNEGISPLTKIILKGI